MNELIVKWILKLNSKNVAKRAHRKYNVTGENTT